MLNDFRRTVTKDNENKGRHFYVCSKKASDPDMCSFFKWEDDNNGSNARAASTFQMSSSSGSSNTRQNTWPSKLLKIDKKILQKPENFVSFF